MHEKGVKERALRHQGLLGLSTQKLPLLGTKEVCRRLEEKKEGAKVKKRQEWQKAGARGRKGVKW